ncbi:MAG: arginine--tRNA ligase [Alphaproteobacteria bacterium]|nr:arginine--tRNA ligase [Alphaproteobacteria bacterium]
MNVFKLFKERVRALLDQAAAAGRLPAGLDHGRVEVEPPRDPTHGDLACNAAMVLAKAAGQAPRALAQLLIEGLALDPAVESAAIAGPGFVNLRLKDEFWRQRLVDILAAGIAYGDSDIGAGQRVNVEYVSANPTGPMHVGHARGAVVGDVLAAVMEKAGFAVAREFYINDAGAQVDTLAESAYLRYLEARGETIPASAFEGLYPGDYLKPVGAELAKIYGDEWRGSGRETRLGPMREHAVRAMMGLIKADLERLGVRHAVFASERALHQAGRVEAVVKRLADQDLVYTGVLDPPKGKPPEDWEPRPQLLFRASKFGDDIDRPLKKSDGAWTYFAADMAYHLDKLERGFERMVDIWGADHAGYVKRMKAAVAALSGGRAALEIRLCQMVNLFDRGQPVKMSKRSGSFVTLADLIEEVGRDVVRFIMLTRKSDAQLDFDFAKAVEQSKDNPVFYVQYAHARGRSVLRQTGFDRERLLRAPLGRLTSAEEMALIRLLAGWPRLVEGAALAQEPHRVAFYLHDVAGQFHGLWNRGNDDPAQRFIVAGDDELTLARGALVQAMVDVVASGLAVMGVTPVEELR